LNLFRNTQEIKKGRKGRILRKSFYFIKTTFSLFFYSNSNNNNNNNSNIFFKNFFWLFPALWP
jgi:hypothetical protein